MPAQWPAARALERGDVLSCEISASYWDYTGQLLRTFTVGDEPTPLYRELHEVADAAFDAMLARVRPGATAAELVEASALIGDAGFTTRDDLVHGFVGGYLPPVLGDKHADARGGTGLHARGGHDDRDTAERVTPDESAGVQTGELVAVDARRRRAPARLRARPAEDRLTRLPGPINVPAGPAIVCGRVKNPFPVRPGRRGSMDGQPRISYVPLEEMTPEMRAEMERCAREGTPRPESTAVRAHVPAAFWFFANAWNDLFRNGIVDHPVKELCRVYVSRSVKCEYCGNQRSEQGREGGLVEGKYDELLNFESSERYTEREKAALAYAEAIVWTGNADDELWERLNAHFSEPELVELGCMSGSRSASSRGCG